MASETEDFLARVLPWGGEPGYRNIHWMWYTGETDEKGKEKKGATGAACTSLPEALKEVNRRWRNDIYVCLSLQRHRRDQKPGKDYYPASKSQSDALGLKAFWFDFDLADPNDPTKKDLYPDARTIGRELGQFCLDAQLPAPQILVKSGSGGVHCYWILDRVLTVAEWLPVASALKDAALKRGLKIDPTVTADAARIMRVPGSKNWKDKHNPKPCSMVRCDPHDYQLAQIAAPLAALINQPGLPSPGPQASGGLGGAIAGKMSSVFAGLGAPTVSEFGAGTPDMHKAVPVDFERAAAKCGAFREALDTGGEQHANPLWSIMVYAATFSDNGRDIAHKVSDKHPGYTPRGTDDLYDRKDRERRNGNKGWPSCNSIEAAGSPACATCPLRGTIKSPYSVGRVDDDLPNGFRRDPATGCIEYMKSDDQGNVEWVRLSNCGMRDAYLTDDPVTGRTLHFTMVERKSAPKLVVLPQSEIQGRGLDGKLGHFGINCTAGQKPHYARFLVSWIENLSNRQGAIEKAAPYGWHVVDGEIDGFAFDGVLYRKQRREDTGSVDDGMRSKYKTSGKYAAWKRAADFIVSQGRQDLAVLIAASFAAPLVRFTGHSGVTISAWSTDSGIGKSSAMKVGQAVWGSPIGAMQQLTDTLNSVLHKAGKIRHLPLFWDEIKTPKQTVDFVSFAFQLALGKEKDRLNSEVRMRKAGEWATLLVSASNASLVDQISAELKNSPAGNFRIFEYEVQSKPLPVAPELANVIVSAVNDNYGHVGAQYADWLGANHAQAQAWVESYSKLLAQTSPTQADERFWTAAICAVMAGAKAAKTLGFCDFDLKAMWQFLIDTLNANRSMKKVSAGDLNNPVYTWDLLQTFLQPKWNRSILVTDVLQLPPGRPGPNSPGIEIKNLDAGTRLQAIDVRWAEKDGKVRIARSSLVEWLDQQRLGRQEFMRAACRHFNGKEARAALTAGTGLGVSDNRLPVLELEIPAFARGGAPSGSPTSPSASPGSPELNEA